MCMTWNQDQWLASTQEGTFEHAYAAYTLVGEYFNQAGDRALMMADIEGDISNVYNQRGTDVESFYYRVQRPSGERVKPTQAEQIGLATKDLAKRGFLPKPVEVPVETVLAESVLV